MQGNVLLAVLTLAAALVLLIPALVAGWNPRENAAGRHQRARGRHL